MELSARKDPLVQIRDLTVVYHLPDGSSVTGLDRISLEIGTAEAIGLLGESGSGKSTLALSILRLLPANAEIKIGTIRVCGIDLLAATEAQMQQLRGSQIAMVFQHPRMALNPAMRVLRQVAEVIHAHRRCGWTLCRREAKRVLSRVFHGDLDRISTAYPHELSGGECQRVSITQALACDPRLLIADEPTAALDALTQTGLLQIFLELKRTSLMSFLFITHNPGLLPGFADRVLVMQAGRIIEDGDVQTVYSSPRSDCTINLLRSVLSPLRL